MTVRELIEALREMPPNAPALIMKSISGQVIWFEVRHVLQKGRVEYMAQHGGHLDASDIHGPNHMILPLEHQVAAPQLCRRLHEFGAPHATGFQWIRSLAEPPGGWRVGTVLGIVAPTIVHPYAVAELGELLPASLPAAIGEASGYHYRLARAPAAAGGPA